MILLMTIINALFNLAFLFLRLYVWAIILAAVFGMLVSFGNASGLVPPVDMGFLAQFSSLYLTRPSLYAYAAKRSDLEAMAKELFDIVLSGTVKIDIKQRYRLQDAARAHRDLEGRKTTGSCILLP